MSTSDDFRKKAIHKLIDSNRNIRKVIIPHNVQIGRKDKSVSKETLQSLSGSYHVNEFVIRKDQSDKFTRLELSNAAETMGTTIRFTAGGKLKGTIAQQNNADMIIETLVDDILLRAQDDIKLRPRKGEVKIDTATTSGWVTKFFFDANNETMGIGTTSPDGGARLHIKSGTASHVTNTGNTVVIEDSGFNVLCLAASDAQAGQLRVATSNSYAQGFLSFYGSTHASLAGRIYLGTGGSTIAYLRNSDDNMLYLDGNVSEDAFFTEGHIYSSDQNLETGDVVSLSGQKIVKTTSANQKDVVGIVWYQVYKRRDEAGIEVFRNVGDNVPSESKKKRDSLGNYVDQGVQNKSGEWEPTSEFKKLWKVASIGDTRQCSEGEIESTLTGFKVCNQNGGVSKGDLLVTSDTPGYLMKQTDDIIRSSTVGKSMEDITFNSEGLATGIYGFLYCG